MKRKIYKALSILLALTLVFSACMCAIGTVFADTTELTYVVKESGNDSSNGKLPAKALQTIEGAINKASEAGLSTGDTLIVKLHSGTVKYSTKTDGTITLPSHDFKLIIKSYNETVVTLGDGTQNINWGGDVEFGNVKINFGNQYKEFCANGHNLTFNSDTVFAGHSTMSGFDIGKYSEDITVNKSVNVNIGIPLENISLGNNYSGCTYNNDVNVVYNASGNAGLKITSSNGLTTYNKALNIEIKEASGVNFAKPSGGSFAFGENGYMTVLNHTAAVLGTSNSVLQSVADAGKLWVINNKVQAANLISFSGTKGVYNVDTEAYSDIKATNATTGAELTPVEGKLTLTAGVWNVTATKLAQEVTYYVKDQASGGDGTESKPLATIADAINYAKSNAGLTVGDKLTVKTIGTEVTLAGTNVKNSNGDFIAAGNLPSYAFDLVVESADSSVRTKLNVGSYAMANNPSGNTYYKNIELYACRWVSVYLKNSNVFIDNDCKLTLGDDTFLTYGTWNTQGTVGGQKVEINCDTPSKIQLSNNGYAGRTYTGAVNFAANTSGAVTLRFNAYYGGSKQGSTTYKEAVNVVINAASGLSMTQFDGAVFEKGLQIINSAGITMKNCTGYGDLPDNTWIINNKSGNSGLIETTDTVGKYKVNLDNPDHELVVTSGSTTIQYDGSGYITLDKGEYDISIKRDPIYKYYYVQSDGITVESGKRPATAGTKENPVLTYADATRLAAQDGLTEIDVAVILIKAGDTVEWGVSPATMSCQLIVDSTDSYEKGNIIQPQSNDNGYVSLTADTTFKNITLTQNYQWSTFCINEYNLTVDEDAELTTYSTRMWATNYGKKHVKDVSVVIKGDFSTGNIGINADYHDHTATANYSFYVDNPNVKFPLQLGNVQNASAKNIYNGDLTVIIKRATSFSFSVVGKGAEINGGIQLLVDDSVKFPYSVKTTFNNLEVAGGKWYFTDASSTDDFLSFGDTAGVLKTKNNKTAYYRQMGTKQTTVKGGTIDLSAKPGSYTVSDKSIPELTDESHLMCYFAVPGAAHHIATRATVEAGKTYVYEYSVYCNLYADCSPTVREDGDRGTISGLKTISETKIGDYYRIVCEITIPEDYNTRIGSSAFFGMNITSYSEGYWFDRTVYKKGDATKTDLMEGGNKFHSGLNGVAIDMVFWGGIFAKSGNGTMQWESDGYALEVVHYSEKTIKDFIALANPQDGEWWNKKDIVEEKVSITYGKAKGTFKDENGSPIKGTKFALVSDDNTYYATSNAKGVFNFKTVQTGFYELFIVDGKNKVATNLMTFINENDVVTFNVTSDLSSLRDSANGDIVDTDYSTETDGENVDEIVPSGSVSGTVYTPYLETVANLKVCLENVGEVVTDENGNFAFANVPVGTYKLYTVLSDGSTYEFRDVTIEENVDLAVKLKYDPSVKSNADTEPDNGWIVWVIIASVVALVVVAGLVFFLVIKKKRV